MGEATVGEATVGEVTVGERTMGRVGSGCWGFLGTVSLGIAWPIGQPAAAQVVLDGTTGNSQAGQVLTGPTYEIPQSLGTTAGPNLFHSFSQFDLATGEQANFRLDPSVGRVLTRVTGGAASTIDGLLSTPGSSADFFLLNPAGVLFGPRAQLDIGGSFVGTTASSIGFGDQGEFSAVVPQSSALLTVAPSALLFSASSGQITSQSVASAQSSSDGRPRFGLQVPTGESLLFVGGDVLVDGGGVASGGLLALGGRLELGGLAAPGQVLLTDGAGGAGLQLAYPADVALADVLLINNALVSVNGEGGGDLVVNANRLVGLDGGRLVAGTSGPGDGGDLVINAGDIEFRGVFVGEGRPSVASGGGNQVGDGATGNGGETRIVGDRLLLSDGAQLENSTLSTANSGALILRIRDSIQIEEPGSSLSTIIHQGEETTETGKIQLETTRLSLRNGGGIATLLLDGSGKLGDVKINASEIELTGFFIDEDGLFPSSIVSGSLAGTDGIGGAININTDRLLIRDGADITSLLGGRGQSGNIQIDASASIIVGGTQQFSIGGKSELLLPLVASTVAPNATGIPGDIYLNTSELLLQEGGGIVSSSQGIGNAGNINIDADRLEISALSPIEGSLFSGRISSDVFFRGDTGEVTINADEILLKDRAQISSGPSLESGASQSTQIPKGGKIVITANSLTAENTFISSAIAGAEGDGGDIVIQAEDDIRLKDSAISSSILGVFGLASKGSGGNIKVVAETIEFDNSSLLALSLSPQGSAGSIQLQAETLIAQGGFFTTSSSNGDGGNLSLDATLGVLLSNSAEFSTSAGTAEAGGNGGNIRITTPFLIGLPDNNSDIIANAFSGNGGNVTIQAQSIFNFDTVSGATQARLRANASNDISASSQLGQSGIIVLNTPDVDPSRGTVELPGELSDRADQIISSCSRTTLASSFQRTGRSGIPANPNDPQTSGITQADWAPLPQFAVATHSPQSTLARSQLSTFGVNHRDATPTAFNEVTSWQRDRYGRVLLLGQGGLVLQADCAAPQSSDDG